jgi:catechol 2,3-dioxygenase-like lactoylglutathione lyase family enzyme
MIQVKRLGHATFNSPDLERMVDYWTGSSASRWCTRKKIAPSSPPSTARKQSRWKPGRVRSWCGRRFRSRHDTIEQGVMPLKFGHLAYRCKDPVKVTSFYTDVLGFRVSDWMGDRFSFLRCGRDHHSVNFARYDEERLHHIAFEVADMAEVQRSSDLLARNGIHLVWGPIRHLVGHNIAAYHRNPDDQRIEIFAEMDIMRDEELGYFEPRPWHQDFPQRPKVWPADTLRAYWGFGSFGTFPGYP